MKNIFYILSLAFTLSCGTVNQFASTLESEMTRLNVDTAMIIESGAIDEYPLWSPDSQFVAANIMDNWYKFDLKNIKLFEAEWKQQKIGIVVNKGTISDLTDQELKQFYLHSKNGGRKIITQTGEKIELKLSGFSSSLITTQNNAQPTVLWSSGIENCHSLSLSPNEKYVAYLCELNGMFVMKLK